MSAMPLRIEAPTDGQIYFIQRLCEERAYPMAVVYSKTDASILIDELRTGLYWPPEWREAESDESDESEWDDDDVPF